MTALQTANRREAEAVERRWTIFLQSRKMLSRSVTLMRCKPILWILGVEFHHKLIPGNLLHDRGGGD
jgi:hypothetical protein